MDAVLNTPNLVLRPFKLSDAPAFRNLKADPAVVRMTSSFQTGYDLLSAQGFIEIAKTRTSLGHAYDWAITENNQFIGSLGLFRMGGEWAIGYALSRSVWGRGLATEAVSAALKVFQKTYSHQSLKAEVFTDNPGSRKVLLKAGFIQDEAITSGYSLARLGAHPLWNFTVPAVSLSERPKCLTADVMTPLAAVAESA